MRVKRYIVETMPTAMKQIREELGHDAVILSTKDMYIGGFLGMFRKKRIEVIAAVDKTATVGGGKSSMPRPAAPPAPAVQFAAAVAALQKEETAAASPSSAEAQPRPHRVAAVAQLTEERHAPIELRESKPEISALSGPSNGPSRDELLLQEIRQMKDTLSRLTRQSSLGSQLPEPLQQLERLLAEHEVDPELAAQWIESLQEEAEERGLDIDEAFVRDGIRRYMSSIVGSALTGGIAPETRIVYVAGPTGVGKTTTIAKLAAEQLFRNNRKVGLITSDTYRIAAVEQLRTYATILNIPIEVVNSPKDFMRAMDNLAACDLILMDTAGRNFRNEMLVSELNSLFRPLDHSEMYLVLSLTSKYRDMKTIVDHFTKFKLDKVIFTKMDETKCYGPILNFVHDYDVKLSYVTNGQNVPEDIEILQEEALLNLILGE